MNWNLLIKKTNKLERKKFDGHIKLKKEKLRKRADKLNKDMKEFSDSRPLFYRLKDRFHLIYPVSFIILIIWIIPILLFLTKLSNPLFMILLLVYLILTTPISIISLLAPTIKFFAFDLKHFVDEIKVFASSKYMIAVFFEENRLITPIVVKLDREGMFQFDNAPYMSDNKSNFITVGKVTMCFYIKGIPNPLKFDFKKYLNKYIAMKTENPRAIVKDFDGDVIDVAMSSDNLKSYKKARLFEEFFRDYVGEANKIIFAIIGMMSTVVVVFLIAYILK